jgi:hypothetical protein
MLKALILIVIVAVAAYFTNPAESAYSDPAREVLSEAASADLEQVDLGGALGNAVATLGDGEYQSFYVAGKYSLPNAADARVECWGAFTLVQCNRTAAS